MLDGSEFLKGIDLAQKRVREAARKAMAQAGVDVLHDALFEEPTVPIEFGTLRASGSVIVADETGEEVVLTSEGIAGSVKAGGEPGTPATSGADAEHGSIVVAIGFNQPQAARLHEHPEYQFTEPESGGKFLEEKVLPKKDELMARIANRIKTSLEGSR